jgi:hypothetical protein
MTRTRLLLVATAAGTLLAACSQTPTTASPASPRFDGGNTMGSGNFVPVDTTSRGGNTMGGGG